MSEHGNRCAGCGGGPAQWNDSVGEFQCQYRRDGACPAIPAPAAPPEGEDEKPVELLFYAAQGFEDSVYLTGALKARDARAIVAAWHRLHAALAAATARAEGLQKALHTEREGHAKAEALWLEAAKVQRERADTAQAEAERLRGENALAIEAFAIAREQRNQALDAVEKLEAESERRVAAMLRYAIACLTEPDDDRKAVYDQILAGFRALPATPAPETVANWRCVGADQSGSLLECTTCGVVMPTAKAVDHACATPAPGPSEEAEDIRAQCLLPVISAKHEAEAKGFEADAAYLDAIIRQIRAIPLGDVQPGPSAEGPWTVESESEVLDSTGELSRWWYVTTPGREPLGNFSEAEARAVAAALNALTRAPGGQDVR